VNIVYGQNLDLNDDHHDHYEHSFSDDIIHTRFESYICSNMGRKMMMNKVTLKENNEMKYLLFQCVPSSETRGRRPSHNNGCLKWGVRMTKNTTLEIQTKCKWCGNRGRKNAGTVQEYPSRQEAELEMYKRNSTLQFSNTTEVIE